MESEVIREVGRIVVGGYYDYQEIRKASMNRIREIIQHTNEGLTYEKPPLKKDIEEKAFGKEYNDDNLTRLLQKMQEEKKLNETEYDYISRAIQVTHEISALEKQYIALMSDYLKLQDVWEQFLSKVRGISSVLGSNLIKNFGYCERFDTISALWKYCGLHVVDGKAPKREKGKKLEFNIKLRTLCWKIGDSFVKQRTPPYRAIYDAEKIRQLSLIENKADNAPKSKLHADLRSRRKMIKIFLQHYWVKTREMKGLPVTQPYSFDKLGHTHYIPPIE